MQITDRALNHWMDHFYGYGSWSSPLWYVALEESGGNLPEEVAEKVNYFLHAHSSAREPTLCDIRDMYRQLNAYLDGPKSANYSNLFDYRFDKTAVLHNVWKNLTMFGFGYRQEDPGDAFDYQQHTFASPKSARETLIRLYPLPSPHNHAWYYSWLDLPQLPFLKSRSAYQQHLFPARLQSILQQITVHQPEVVLMYGMENIKELKDRIQQAYPTLKFTMVKAIPQKFPQHHIAQANNTTLVITTQIPALHHRRIESGFDWHALGKLVRSFQEKINM